MIARFASARQVAATAALAIALTGALAACSHEPPPPPRVAAWIGEQTGRLFISVLSVEPLRAMALTGPDGRSFQPRQLIGRGGAAPSDYGSRPGIGVFGGGGSSSGYGGGLSIDLPVRNPFGGSGNAYRSSQGEFQLPAEALDSYRRRPQDWRLELSFDSASASLPAPPLQR
ncbi:MAG TPA: hypothetical protein VF194_08960 [Ferrovibrio sp.]|uniref:hypothetical protein n=1 Tax=Ferrovibrio sp. TaxID=1917215 RepID=UPI002ED34024